LLYRYVAKLEAARSQAAEQLVELRRRLEKEIQPHQGSSAFEEATSLCKGVHAVDMDQKVSALPSARCADHHVISGN
jgi:hypothetical protein